MLGAGLALFPHIARGYVHALAVSLKRWIPTHQDAAKTTDPLSSHPGFEDQEPIETTGFPMGSLSFQEVGPDIPWPGMIESSGLHQASTRDMDVELCSPLDEMVKLL